MMVVRVLLQLHIQVVVVEQVELVVVPMEQMVVQEE
jgi:hypothetical protein